jgi:hypothetical protein
MPRVLRLAYSTLVDLWRDDPATDLACMKPRLHLDSGSFFKISHTFASTSQFLCFHGARRSEAILYHNHILEKAQVPLVCCCKSPLLVPPLKLSCINILSARDSTPVDPGHLNREYQHSIGHPSWEPRFSNRVSLHLSKSTQWRGVSKKGRWAVRAKRQMRHADMQVKALHPTNVCGRRDGL